MELDISDIQRNIEYNDDVIIEGSIQHNVEDEYKDKLTEQEAIIEEIPIKHEERHCPKTGLP